MIPVLTGHGASRSDRTVVTWRRRLSPDRSPLNEGTTMSDTPKKAEQSPEQPNEKIADLPTKNVSENDAEAVKGGALNRFK